MKKFTFIDETGNENEETFKAKKKKVREASRLNLAVRRNYRIVPVNDRRSVVHSSQAPRVEKASIDNRQITRTIVTESSWRVTTPVPHQGYARAAAHYNFDLLNLSALCSMHMGLPAATALHATEGRLVALTQERQASYLDFVPARYDHNPLIRAAVDCVLAKARRIVCSDDGIREATVLGLWGKALRELQAALNDLQRIYDADVLCASLLMQLYAVLDFSNMDRWRSHAGGVIKLVRLRGPERYRTAFERALLMTQLPAAYAESLDFHQQRPNTWTSQDPNLMGNYPYLGVKRNVMGLRGVYHAIFLAQPEWKSVLNSIPELPDSEQHPIATTLWTSHSGVQPLVRVVSDYIMGSYFDANYQEYLLAQLCTLDNVMQQWQEDCNRLLLGPEGHNKSWKPRELLGFSYAARLVLARLIVGMDPLKRGREYENLVQELARCIIQLSNDAKQQQPHRGDLFLQRPQILAGLAFRTKEIWWAAVEGTFGHVDTRRGVITQMVFSNMSVLSGRPKS